TASFRSDMIEVHMRILIVQLDKSLERPILSHFQAVSKCIVVAEEVLPSSNVAKLLCLIRRTATLTNRAAETAKMTLFEARKVTPVSKISLNVRRRQVKTSLHRRCPKLTTESECCVRPDEVVIATEQLDVIFEMFLPPRLTNRSPT